MIKMFKMSELPKRDTEKQNEQILLLKKKKILPIDLLNSELPQTLNL